MKVFLLNTGLLRPIFVIGLVLCLNSAAALAEVVPVVSVDNPLTTLSRYQVVDIFLGKTSRFPDGSQAVPIDQAEGTEAREEFYEAYVGKSSAQLKAHWSKIIFTGRGQPPNSVSDDNYVKLHLSQNPNAIGYIDRDLVDDSVKLLVVQ